MNRTSLACLLIVVASGCGGNDDSPPAPPDPPRLRLDGFITVDGHEFDASCAELGADADQTLLVQLKGSSATAIDDWILRPPGTCGSTAACGHLQVRVDPRNATTYGLGTTGATTTLAVPFAAPCPQTASSDECQGIEEPTGEHTVEITLRDDDGYPVVDSDGSVVRLTVQVTLAAPGGCR